MQKFIYIIFLFLTVLAQSQNEEKVFQDGEELKYRVHYGFVNAGYAT